MIINKVTLFYIYKKKNCSEGFFFFFKNTLVVVQNPQTHYTKLEMSSITIRI